MTETTKTTPAQTLAAASGANGHYTLATAGDAVTLSPRRSLKKAKTAPHKDTGTEDQDAAKEAGKEAGQQAGQEAEAGSQAGEAGAAPGLGGLLMGAPLLLLAGLGGGGSDGPAPLPKIVGYLVDSPVGGVDYYVDGKLAGTTEADGSFRVAAGDRVTFRIGSITLAENVVVPADKTVYVQDLLDIDRSTVNDPALVRIAQLLQSLDADNNPDNGIQIDASRLRKGLGSVSITETTVIADLLKPGVAVVSEVDALDHLNDNSKTLRGMDDTAPEGVITLEVAEVGAAGAVVTVTFSERVLVWTDLAGVLTVSAGSLSEARLSADGRSFTAFYTPPAGVAAGTAQITLNPVFTDRFGNKGISGAIAVDYDTVAPSLSAGLEPDTLVIRSDSALLSDPHMAAVAYGKGRVVVTVGADGTGDSDILVQVYGPTGRPIGGAVRLEAPDEGMHLSQDSAPQVTVLMDGSFVVVWTGQDAGGDNSVFVQRFSARGETLGPVLTLEGANAPAGQDVFADVVPVGGGADFVVVWQGQTADGVTTILTQKIPAVGSVGAVVAVPVPEGAAPQVSGDPDCAPHAVALGEDGAFAVVWSGVATEGGRSVFVQRFDGHGAADGAAVVLEGDGGAGGVDSAPDVSVLGADGSFAVAWQGLDADGDLSIFVQRFDAAGAKAGDATRLEAAGNASGADSAPQITLLGEDGGYAVTWQGETEGGDVSIFVQRFDSAGVALGGMIRLDAADNAAGLDGRPQITALGGSGGFAVTWQGTDADGDQSVYVQTFAADGMPASAQVKLEAPGHGDWDDTAPRIEPVFKTGGFAVIWGGQDAGGTAQEVFVQEFTSAGLPLVKPMTPNAETVATAGVPVRGSEDGVAFLVKAGVDLSGGVAALSAVDGARWNSVAIEAGKDALVPTEGLEDGTYVLVVADAAGNLSAPLPRAVVIDQTRPVLTITDDKAEGIANGEVTYTFTFSEGVFGFTEADVTVLNGTKGAFRVLSDGPLGGTVYSLVVTPTADAEGADIGLSVGTGYLDLANNAPAGVTTAEAQPFDRIAPVAPDVALDRDTGSVADDLITSDGALHVVAEDGARIEYQSAGGSWTDAPTLSEGENTIKVRAVDAAGNASEATQIKFTLDRTADAPTVSLQADTGESATDTVTSDDRLAVSGETGAVFEYSTDGGDTWSGTMPVGAEGENSVLVRQTDLAGNVSEPARITYVKDTVVAPPTIALANDTGREGEAASFTDGITRDPKVTVSGLEEGASWAYRVDGAGDWIAGSGSFFLAGDGTHSYEVRQTDKAGNQATSAALTVTAVLDPAPVSVALYDSTDAPITGSFSNDPGTVLRVAGAVTDQWQYRFIDPDTGVAGDWQDMASSKDLPVDEGRHLIETRKIDLANNYVSAVTRVVIDSTAEIPTMTLVNDTGDAGDGVTTDPTVTIGGVEARSTWDIRVVGQGEWSSFTNGQNTYGLLPGTHQYEIRQTDAAGNVSATGTYVFTYQPEPVSLKITLADGTDVSNLGVATAETELQVTGLSDGATWQYRIDGGSWVDGSGTSLPILSDGAAHSYEFRETLAGNHGTVVSAPSVRFDNVAPDAFEVALASDSGASDSDGVTNVPDITLSGLEVGAVLHYRTGEGDWRSTTVTQPTMTLPLQDGAQQYQFRLVDAAGNSTATVTRTYSYFAADVAPPSLALAQDTAAPGDGLTANGQIDVTLAGGAGAGWQYQVDGGSWTDGTGSSFAASEGAHLYRVRQVDLAGNTSAPSDALAVTLDSAVPVFTSGATAVAIDADGHMPGMIGTDRVVYTATASDASGLRLGMVENDTFRFDPVTGKLSFAQPVGFRTDGQNSYSATLTATDDAGNVTQKVVTVTVGRDNTAAPTIELAEPRSGVLTSTESIVQVYRNADGTSFQSVKTGSNAYVLEKVDANGVAVDGFTPYTFPTGPGLYAATATRLVTLPDGKIMIGYNGGFNQVIRLNADGTPDTTYGTNGVLSVSASPSGFSGPVGYGDINIDSSGRVYLLGSGPTSGFVASSYDSALAIFKPDGSLQSATKLSLVSGGIDILRNSATGANGVVYLVGSGAFSTGTGANENGAVVLKYVDGVRDTSFASAGTLSLPGATNSQAFASVLVDGSGGLILSRQATNTSVDILRYTSSGAAKPGFGTAGVVTIPNAMKADVQLMADNSFYVRTTNPNTGTSELRHYLASGALDTGFGTNGVFADPTTGIQDFYVSEDGKLSYMVGSYANVTSQLQYSIVGGKPVADAAYGDTSLTYNEGNRPIGLLNGASALSDADAAVTNYDGFTLTIGRKGGASAEDVFGARGKLVIGDDNSLVWNGTVVGSVAQANGSITLTFNDKVTQSNLTDIARAITYRNTSQTPISGIVLSWTLADNDPAGSKQSSASQFVNLKNDNADLGIDRDVTVKVGSETLVLGNMITVDGKTYSVIKSIPNAAFLDNVFNYGADRTVDSRTATLPDGSTIKMLTAAEITAVTNSSVAKADPFWSAIFSFDSGKSGVVAADLGTSADTHMARYFFQNSFSSVSDGSASSFWALVEVKRGNEAPGDSYINPALRLMVDNGDSDTDRITSDGRFEVVGLNSGLPIDVSVDGGKTWTQAGAGTTVIDIPAGTYAAGVIQVRQTDLSGFVDTISNAASVKIDKNIKTVNLFNDQGLSASDGKTADGRVYLTGISGDAPYEYTIDGGGNWLPGGKLDSGEFGFVLANGSYAAGSIRIRQGDADGFVSTGRNSAAITVGPQVGQGDIKLVIDNGASTTDRISSEDRMIVTGLDRNQNAEFSIDGGNSWTPLTNTDKSVSLEFRVPEGSYAAGLVLVRQTDSKGFTATISNSQTFAVDKSVKNLGLLNDQGVSVSDNQSADGRMIATGLNAALPYSYSTDNGVTWTLGTLSGGKPVFTLPSGTFAPGVVQVKQDIGGGLTNIVKSTVGITVGPQAGQGDIKLDLDTGLSATDGLTNAPKLSITGLRDTLGWDYSLDGGQTWTPGARNSGTKQVLALPDGSYAVDQIVVRQTDANGFVTQVKNGAAWVVDTQIATPSIALVADTGFSATDLITADGRVRFNVTGTLNAGDRWSYTLDGGKTWVEGAGTSATVTLGTGTYAANAIRVKVTDAAGNAKDAAFDKPLTVADAESVAPVITSAASAIVRDADGTGTRTLIAPTTPLLTVTATDANVVYYTLSGRDAALFDINPTGQITFKTATNLQNPAGDRYQVVVTATDAFGNATSQNVTLNVASPIAVVEGATRGYYDTLKGSNYQIVFNQDITLAPAGKIVLTSGQTGAKITLDASDSDHVKVVGNKLLLSIDGLTDQGQYSVALDGVVSSTLTGEGFVAPSWPKLGFWLDQSVTYQYDSDAKTEVISSEGSFVVKAVDGKPVSGAAALIGDVNGDGLDDWAMTAANGDSNGRSDNGKVYVVYGRADGAAPDLAQVAQGKGGFVISGAGSGDLAGMQVEAAGDVNNDGLADIALFAPGGNGGAGKGYVVLGQRSGGNLDLAAIDAGSGLGRVYTNSVKDSFGGIGDVNGDGYDDIGHGRVDLDRVTTYDVRREWTTTMNATTSLVQKADWLNFAANIADTLSTVYSFFDDPLTALLETGAEWKDALENAIQDGEADMDPIQKAIFDAITQRQGMLGANQRITDINVTQSGGGGGGWANPPKDLVITINFTIETRNVEVTRYTNTLFGAGEAVLEFGAASGTTSGSSKVIGTINATQVGSDVTGLGDINGDGRADFAVLETGSGGVLAQLDVVFGKRSLTDLPTNNLDAGIGGFRIRDPNRSAEYVGEGNVTGLGDINGDGLSDFALTLDSVNAGTYVVYGRAGMTGVDLNQVKAGNGGYLLAKPDSRAQRVVEAIGDFNGDGLDDFVTYRLSSSTTDVSEVQVIYGSAGKPTMLDKTFPTAADYGFGAQGFSFASTERFQGGDMVSAGDINGDGLTDLVFRGNQGSSLVLMGSATSGKFSQVHVDQLGGMGNDTLVSSGTDLLVGGAGNDAIRTLGADVVLAGAGDDRITLDAGTITALSSVLGQGGNLGQLARIDGGSGIDTLSLSGGAVLDFTRIGNKMIDADNIAGRVAGIEHIDMQTDAAANTVKIALSDVLETGSSNVFNTATGWVNVTGSALSGTVQTVQLAIEAGSNDRVELVPGQWTNTGQTVRDTATNEIYAVYQATNGVAAQLFIDRDAVVL